MANQFIGEIKLFAGNFAPPGWAFCDGQLLPIAGNEALFNLIGTTYGGDGAATFALPDLQGRVPIHMGNGVELGDRGGDETVGLNVRQLPMHTHLVTANSESATQTSPSNALPAALENAYSNSTTAPTSMAPTMLSPSGGNQPHENMQPFLVVSYIISLVGLTPLQN